MLSQQSASGTVAWYLPDRLGTIRDLIDSSGTIIDHVDYSAFGTQLDESAPSVGDRMMGFAGLQRDTVTGLNLAVHRVQNPGTGRWTSQDSLGFAANDTNLFRYGFNNPTDRTDPTGLEVYLRPSPPWKIGGHIVAIHYGIIVWDPVTKMGLKYDGGGQGTIGVIGTGCGTPTKKWRYLGPLEGPRPSDILVNTNGNDYNKQLWNLSSAFNNLIQIPQYNATMGPNSNTFANQLLQNAGYPTTAPPSALGWGYDGVWGYGTSCSIYDKNGKRLPSGMPWWWIPPTSPNILPPGFW